MNRTFKKAFPVPDKLVEIGDRKGWEDVEEKLNTHLPPDYKEFIDTYGTGCISNFLWIFNPFSKNTNLNLLIQVDSYRKQYESLKEQIGDEACPYPLFPEANGLMSLGVSDNGDVFFWLTKGAPSKWVIIINKTRSNDFETHNCNITKFLVGVISGKIKSQVFVKEFIDAENSFLTEDEYADKYD